MNTQKYNSNNDKANISTTGSKSATDGGDTSGFLQIPLYSTNINSININDTASVSYITCATGEYNPGIPGGANWWLVLNLFPKTGHNHFNAQLAISADHFEGKYSKPLLAFRSRYLNNEYWTEWTILG